MPEPVNGREIRVAKISFGIMKKRNYNLVMEEMNTAEPEKLDHEAVILELFDAGSHRDTGHDVIQKKSDAKDTRSGGRLGAMA